MESSSAKNAEPNVPIVERTVLVLGNTGAGKSTFINALANILSFDSLQDALDADNVKCLIATSIRLDNDQINVPGEDKTTKLPGEVGDSVTTVPRSNVFTIGNCKLHLVDSPGFMDTGGTENDAQNINMIMEYVSEFPQLAAILIVMDPHNVRINQFKDGFEMLLKILHKDMLRNIFFVFTKARSFNYILARLPTKTLLQKYLNNLSDTKGYKIAMDDQHVFCMDNEFLEYLYGMKKANSQQSAHITGGYDRTDMEKCFGQTRKEMLRFWGQIFNSQELQSSSGMVSLHQSKQLVKAMSKSFPVVITAIEDNKSDLKKLISEYKKAELDSRLLKEKLKIPITYVEIVNFDKWRLVCKSCNVSQEQDASGQLRTVYGQICCRGCEAIHISFCSAISWALWSLGYCKACKCSSDKHEYIKYECRVQSRFRNAQDRSDEVVGKLHSVEELKAEKERRIEELEMYLREDEEELEIIIEAAAKCQIFMKLEAVMEEKDFFHDAIQQKISEAEKFADMHEELRVKADRFKEIKDKYGNKQRELELMKITVTEDDIKKIRSNLIGLTKFGGDLKKILDAEMETLELDESEHHANVQPTTGVLNALGGLLSVNPFGSKK